MKTVTVIRKVPLKGIANFEVRADGEMKGSFSFGIGADEKSIWNEEKNRLAAMELAAKLESGVEDIEEIIYQTKIK